MRVLLSLTLSLLLLRLYILDFSFFFFLYFPILSTLTLTSLSLPQQPSSLSLALFSGVLAQKLGEKANQYYAPNSVVGRQDLLSNLEHGRERERERGDKK